MAWNTEDVQGHQLTLVAPVPPADGTTAYTESITGGAVGYEGAGGMALVTPVSATEYKVSFTGLGIG
ncbi:hypothetical protein [Saccharothrix sp. ST-888]|uniref:hypothetical protein n=1 Tax=Saccharothrix sp. ST-888 TaxID=1427391 RepID=UPI0005ED00CF|nr:hypothetical protein [Saccharothrix sp. ST-888]KJK56421.1 hypothetical protein UK12_22670 [Saccharothrix sp. ST-888]